MKKRLPRELLWMTLPVALFGGGIWLLPLIRQLRGGPPAGIEKGTPRLVAGKWKLLKPRAVDFARGLSASIEADVWSGGECPASSGPMTSEGFDFPADSLHFVFRRGGHWQRHTILYRNAGADYWATFNPYFPNDSMMHLFGKSASGSKMNQRRGDHIEIHLPMDQVPHDATEVRLQGRLNGYMGCQDGTHLQTHSAPIDFLLKSSEQEWPAFKGIRQSDMRFLYANQLTLKRTSPSLLAPTIQLTAVCLCKNDEQPKMDIAYSWIEDADKKFVTSIDKYQCYQQGHEGLCLWRYNPTLWKGKPPFTLNTWIYKESDKWPLLAHIPLPAKPFGSSR